MVGRDSCAAEAMLVLTEWRTKCSNERRTNPEMKPSSAECSRRAFLQLPGSLVATRMLLAAPTADCLWLTGPKDADSHVAFRGGFSIASAEDVELRFLGATWFVVWVDGEYRSEGPARFVREYPEFQTLRLRLEAGRHVIAAQVHYEGLATRMLEDIPPFWMCAISSPAGSVPVQWRARSLGGYRARVRRVNAQLGWIEWSDTRKAPPLWRQPDFDDKGWATPTAAHPGLGTLEPLRIGEVQAIVHPLQATAAGELVEYFGYELDDPPARLFLRHLEPGDLPAQGVWRRYDLGRVRLGRPRLLLDLPEGAVVEIAYSEALENGRVNPWINLSAGSSCNLDHFIARGGEQEFFPLAPKGGRFLEVHVIAPPAAVRFNREEYVERTYHGTPEGSLETGDALLDRIWMTGIETYRACSEDAVIDNPTRERGQWAGDVASVGIEIASCGYSDLRLFERGLIQCARCARDDGMVAGLCPGGRAYLSTYAAQWVSACLRYWEMTGDISLLEQLLPAAERNMAAFVRRLTPDGVADAIGWGFVDWGYVRNASPSDIGVNLHFLAALRDMERWCGALARPDRRAYYSGLAVCQQTLLSKWFEQVLISPDPWQTIGLHRAVLALRLGLFSSRREDQAVASIKRHILSCFPLDPAGPRLSDPAAATPRLFTPYFAHYALPELIRRGEMDFVLDVYRKAWGWALGDGRTTWLEVFDTRWSHCHQWSGGPTWQMSRYLLGLHPTFHRGRLHYSLLLRPGSLAAVKGRLPVPGESGVIHVEWRREGSDIHYRLETPLPLVLHPESGAPVQVTRLFEHVFHAADVC